MKTGAVSLYLASRSPRRRELLALAGVAFGIVDVEIDETPRAGEDPVAYVDRMAAEKAGAGWTAVPSAETAVVLAADTTVVLGGRVLGKPADAAEARTMLAALAGRRHRVYTAVAVRRGERIESIRSESTVQFASMSPRDIADYVATGEPMDKAGAYAVQGRAQRYIERVEGSVSGIVGLPLYETLALLERFGTG